LAGFAATAPEPAAQAAPAIPEPPPSAITQQEPEKPQTAPASNPMSMFAKKPPSDDGEEQ
jgi:hypothetical protein